ARWKLGVCERRNQVEVSVVNVNFVVPEIGGIDKGAGSGDREAGVDGTGTGVVHRDQCVVWIEVRPAADGAVEGAEEERRGPSVDLEFRRTVVDDTSG